jgi:hypothetical protein
VKAFCAVEENQKRLCSGKLLHPEKERRKVMNKQLNLSIYGMIGLAGFGVGYDTGFFGPTDGHDHSAVVTVAGTGSTGLSGGVVLVSDAIMGNDIAVTPPSSAAVVIKST